MSEGGAHSRRLPYARTGMEGRVESGGRCVQVRCDAEYPNWGVPTLEDDGGIGSSPEVDGSQSR